MPSRHPVVAIRILALVGLLVACDERTSTAPEDVLRSASLDLAGAIAVAERAEPNGRSVEAEFEERGDQAIYEVALLVGDEVREVFVDPATGKVIGTGVDPEDLEEARASAAALEQGKLGLVDAIAAAERETKGQAFEVEVGDAAIEVRVLLDSGAKIVTLDLASGRVVSTRDDGESIEVEEAEDDDGEADDD